jgi:hypothetical protein
MARRRPPDGLVQPGATTILSYNSPILYVVSWDVESTIGYDKWFSRLPVETQRSIVARVDVLAEEGPGLGRPLVDTVKGSKHPNMKELRVPGAVRILFAFDNERNAVLLVGGSKRGQWQAWYRKAIKEADRLFDEHLRAIRKRE